MGEKRHPVLIADDYEADRFFIKEAIRRHAPKLHIVGEVADGEEVIAYLSGEGQYANREAFPLPELLILDVRMPGMSGIEVLEWLEKNPFPKMKVALMADSSSMIYRSKAQELGIEHFYSKLMGRQEVVLLAQTMQKELEDADKSALPAGLTEIPPLQVDNLRIEANEMPVIVIWGNQDISRFFTLLAAKAALITERYFNQNNRALGAKAFVWNGTLWEQAPCNLN